MNNEDMDKALIGHIMTKHADMVNIASSIKPEYLLDDSIRELYLIQLSLWKEGIPPNLLNVSMKNMKLAGLATECSSHGFNSGGERMVIHISERAKRSRIDDNINSILGDTFTPDEKLGTLIELYNNEMSNKKVSGLMADSLERTYNNIERYKKEGVGVKTGLRIFDTLDIQYMKGHFWLITAFTSVGKTAFSIEMVRRMLEVKHDASILIISTEMTEEQIVARLIGNHSDIYPKKVLAGKLLGQDAMLEAEAIDFFKETNITIVDDVFDLEEVEHEMRKKKLKGGLDMVVVDYVQNMTYSKATSMYQEGAQMAKRLQQVTKECECSMIALSQVSNDKAKGNSDILEAKGAGEWSAVADIGIELSRAKDPDNVVGLEVKKNRHGAKGRVNFQYSETWSRLYQI